MKQILYIILQCALIFGFIGLIVFGLSCFVGWKLALVWVVAMIILFIWIGNDIHNCAYEDSNGNIFIPTKDENNGLKEKIKKLISKTFTK